MTELTFSKSIEMFTESIPGIIIQLASIFSTITAGNNSVATMSFVSFFVSILTTAFVSAQISYGKSFDSKTNCFTSTIIYLTLSCLSDFDTDPMKRAMNPEFYGYVPDT